jgi:transposase
VRFVDAFGESLHLKELGFKRVEPNEVGRPSYDPYDMLKLFVYGYLNQVRSSRKLERECHRTLEVVWMMKKLTPDFKTISSFRKDNIDCIKPVFKEFVYLCKSLDLFGAELVGIDGSKFRAVNSKQRNFNEAKLAETLKRLEEKMARYLKEMEENDDDCGTGDEQQDGNGSGKLKEKIARLEEKRGEYIQAQNLMRETGQREVSLTDPDSRLMKNNGKLDVCYNTETAIDSKNKLVVDYDVTNVATDQDQLGTTAEAAKETLGVKRIDVTSDRGFFSAVAIKERIDNGITPHLPELSSGPRGEAKSSGIPVPEFHKDKFVYDKKTDSYVCPAGQRLEFLYWLEDDGKTQGAYRTSACASCPFFMTRCTRNKDGRTILRWEHEDVLEEMRARLKTVEGRRKLLVRKELREHPFGTIKRAFNQGYLLMKGLESVRGEMGFAMLAYNMRRAVNILGVKALMACLTG